MPCLFMLVAAALPRLALLLMWVTGYGARAFETALWPVMGFLFLPFTTCAYAIGINAHGSLTGWALVLFVVGVLLDVGGRVGGAQSYRVHYADGR